jgi:hypothetical protein
MFYKRKKLIYFGLLFIFIGVWGICLFESPHYNPVKTCKSNLSILGHALHKYYDIYHSFPPSFVTNANGLPMHSWRALILPYLDQETPIKYNYDEAWDSSYNCQFHDKMPLVFCCSHVPKYLRQSTPSYVMITGQNTVGNGQHKIIKYDTTILLVEIQNANFNWLEPIDISLESLQYTYHKHKKTPNLIGSYHDDRIHDFGILTCDLTVYFLSFKKNDIEVIKAMSTIDSATHVIKKEDKKTGQNYFELLVSP